MLCYCVQIPLGDQKRLDAVPSLVGQDVEFEGVGWEESCVDVILSSIGHYRCSFFLLEILILSFLWLVNWCVLPHVGPGHHSSPLSIYFLIFSPFYFSLSFIGFTYFLLLSIPSLSTRIVPLRFQARGRRRRPNLGLVCYVCVICIP